MSPIFGSSLDDSKCGSGFFSFKNTPVREMMESHSELALVRLHFLHANNHWNFSLLTTSFLEVHTRSVCFLS